MGSDHQHIPNFIVETDGEHHLPDYAPGEQAKLNTIIDRLQKVCCSTFSRSSPFGIFSTH